MKPLRLPVAFVIAVGAFSSASSGTIIRFPDRQLPKRYAL
jgi:hypothetical protein